MNITQHQSKKIQKKSWNSILDNKTSRIHYVKCITSGYVKLNYSGCINEKFFDEYNFINKSFYKPVISHLLFHEDYGYLLIDAGLDETFTYNPYGSQKGIKLKEVGSKFKQNPNTTVLNYIKKHNIKLSYIFLTHLHIDHIAGLLNLDDNIPIYFSSLEKSMDVKPYYYGEYLKNKKTIKILNLDNFTKMPDFGLCMDIFNDNTFFAIHTPGHTPGHLSYLINGDEKILIAGDVFYINESVKYEVAPSDYMNNITIAQKSLEKLLNFRKKYNTKIIAGHENIMI